MTQKPSGSISTLFSLENKKPTKHQRPCWQILDQRCNSESLEKCGIKKKKRKNACSVFSFSVFFVEISTPQTRLSCWQNSLGGEVTRVQCSLYDFLQQWERVGDWRAGMKYLQWILLQSLEFRRMFGGSSKWKLQGTQEGSLRNTIKGLNLLYSIFRGSFSC